MLFGPVAISTKPNPFALGLLCGIAALSAAALVNRYLAKKAERDNPPRGQFAHVNGVKLHYLDQGTGEPLVLLHGNGSMIQDFQSSGLIAMASKKYQSHCFRPSGIWSQSSSSRNHMDT